MRKNNKMDMTVIEQIESIKQAMCNDYCKYPSEYHEKVLRDEIQNDDVANDTMCEEICSKCPLTEL